MKKYVIYSTEPQNPNRFFLSEEGKTTEIEKAKKFEYFDMRELRKKYPSYGIEEVESE